MTARRIALWFSACFLVAASVRAQGVAPDAFVDTMGDRDMQFFSPVDFDLDGQAIDAGSGYFFRYSRLNWAFTGERTTIGAPGLQVASEQIFAQNPFDIGLAAQTYTINNGITEAPPNGNFGWGSRYELGKFDGGNGWLIGVLDGPSVSSTEIYGFQELAIPGTLPLSTQQADPNFNAAGYTLTSNTDDAIGTGGANISTTRNGFGSVHVNFNTPTDYLKGWRDYNVNGVNNVGGPTTGGPGLQVAGITIANGLVTAINIRTGADGLVDNINGIGSEDVGTFYFVFQDTDGNGQFDDGEPILGTGVDHGDLHTFNIRFNTLTVRNSTRTDGIEVMRTVELDNRHLPVKEQTNKIDIAYGARFLKITDEFSWDGDIDTMGRTFQNTDIENQIVGPQIRARWTHQRNRLSLGLDGRFMFGYNVADNKQTGGIGQGLTPGAVNTLINAQPTFVRSGRQDNFFSPVAELRVESRYQVTGALAAKLGYTGIFVDNITRASSVVNYTLPDLGILPGGNQEIFMNGVDFGFEAVY